MRRGGGDGTRRKSALHVERPRKSELPLSFPPAPPTNAEPARTQVNKEFWRYFNPANSSGRTPSHPSAQFLLSPVLGSSQPVCKGPSVIHPTFLSFYYKIHRSTQQIFVGGIKVWMTPSLSPLNTPASALPKKITVVQKKRNKQKNQTFTPFAFFCPGGPSTWYVLPLVRFTTEILLIIHGLVVNAMSSRKSSQISAFIQNLFQNNDSNYVQYYH